MFSANPSISPTRLKPSDVANEVGQGERGQTGGNGVGLARNGVGLGGTGSDWRERGQAGGTRSDWGGNGVGLGGTGSDWGERGRTGGNGIGLVGSDWGIRGGASSFGPTLCLRCAQTARLYVKRRRAGCTGQGEPFEGRNSQKGIIVLNGIITTFHVIFSYSRKTRTCGHIS